MLKVKKTQKTSNKRMLFECLNGIKKVPFLVNLSIISFAVGLI